MEGILKLHPEIDFTVFSHDPLLSKKLHDVKAVYPLPFGFRSFFRGNFLQSFKSLKETDLVIIGGGGLLTDEKIKAILIWGWHFLWAKIFRKPVFFYANSVGPLNTKIGKFLAKMILSNADFITVRDKESGDLLNKLGVKRFEITADPAFLISVPRVQENMKKKKIAFSLRNWIKHEDRYVTALKEAILELETQGFQILLISMQTFQDDDRLVLEKIKSPNSLIISPKDFTELLQILNNCQFTIGMRLHFLIASALVNIPFITISYSQKTDSFAKKLKQDEFLLPISEVTSRDVVLAIKKIEEKREGIKFVLKNGVEDQKKKAEKNKIVFKAPCKAEGTEKFIAKLGGKS